MASMHKAGHCPVCYSHCLPSVPAACLVYIVANMQSDTRNLLVWCAVAPTDGHLCCLRGPLLIGAVQHGLPSISWSQCGHPEPSWHSSGGYCQELQKVAIDLLTVTSSLPKLSCSTL